HRAAPQAALIARLNPVIRGWCNYFNSVVSKETYSSLDNYLWELTWHWANRRHPNKSGKWVANRYWRPKADRKWNFAANDKVELAQHSETEIIRHIKVKSTASPYDGNTVYWGKRLRKSPDISTRVIKLLKLQKGICTHCNSPFKVGDKWEVDHKIPLSKKGKDGYCNLQLLHDYCHDSKSAHDGSRCRTHDKSGITEEPDEAKVSCPVLKTSRSGDGLA
ncbi:MAG: HNH endonuclease, partial [Hormoscilla sp. GM102CHS1]|nr:HNH endonuclease [Hormoscilla sp. GM102CHS1]